MEYVLTTTHAISTSVGHAVREPLVQALDGIIGQLHQFAPQVPPLPELLLRSPVATAAAAGLLVLCAGLLLARRG